MKQFYYILILVFTQLCFGQTEDIKKMLEEALVYESSGAFDKALSERKRIESFSKTSRTYWAEFNRYKIMLNESFVQKSDSLSLQYAEKAKLLFDNLEQKSDKENALLLEQLAIRQYDNYLDAESISSAKKALNLYKKIDDFDGQSTIIKFLIRTLDGIGKYEEALLYAKTSLALQKKKHGNIHEEVVKAYSVIGDLCSRTNAIDEQIKAFKTALQIAEKNPPKDKFLLYNIYFSLAVTYYYYGDNPSSKLYLDKLNFYYNKHKNDNTFFNHKSDSNSNLNEVISLKALVNVLYYKSTRNITEINKNILLFERQLPKDLSTLSENDMIFVNDIYIQQAIYYTQNEPNYEKSIVPYQKAIALNVKNNFSAGLLSLYFHKGFTENSFDKWNEAVSSFETFFKTPGHETFYLITSAKENLGSAYYHTKQYKKAEQYFSQIYQFYNTNSNSQLSFESITSLCKIGQIYIDIFKKNKSKQTLVKAYDCFKMSSIIFSKIYQGDAYNSLLTNKSETINAGLLYCSVTLNDKKGEVLELIEKNNSDYLWSNFVRNQQQNKFEKPMKLKDSVYRLEIKADSIATLIKTENNKFSKRKLENEANELKMRIENVKKTIQKQYPSFFNFTNSEIAHKEIQKDLKTGEVLLKYVVLPKESYVFTITNATILLDKLLVPSDVLKTKVALFKKNLSNPLSSITSDAKTLHSYLLGSVDASFFKNKRIIVVTDRFLSSIPFETLYDGNAYLVEKNSISYANSVKLLAFQRMSEINKNFSIVAFAPTYDSADKNSLSTNLRSLNNNLEGAEKETETISKLFDATLFQGKAATKGNFLANLSNYSIFHLAMHGTIDDESSLTSSLLFSKSEPLFLNDLYSLKIPADLAVLSACNTGVGKSIGGEGVVNLSRAFTFAGVKSTVYSLWEVPDVETSEIMVLFYENLKNGMNKADALADAKIAFISNNPSKKHPFYWAGFVVNGDETAIASGFKYKWFVLFGVLLLLGIGFLVRKNYSNS